MTIISSQPSSGHASPFRLQVYFECKQLRVSWIHAYNVTSRSDIQIEVLRYMCTEKPVHSLSILVSSPYFSFILTDRLFV